VLSLVIVVLVVLAFRKRSDPAVGGRGGVLRAAILASVVVVVTALFGAVIVKLELQNRLVVVTHLVLAMVLIAALVAAALRAGGFGAPGVGPLPNDRGEARAGVSSKTARVATIGAGLTLVVIVFGALTANLPGAAESCLGFPHCRVAMQSVGGLLHLQLTHRILAFLLLFHMIGAAIAIGKRGEARPVVTAARVAAAAIILQVLVAAALVETRLPPALQSVHQAVGTLVWVAVIAFALLARRGANSLGTVRVHAGQAGHVVTPRAAES
jgi:heme A synthase